MANDFKLCRKCGGNGVLQIPHGISICPRCQQTGYEPYSLAEEDQQAAVDRVLSDLRPSIQQCEAELFMAKQFLHEVGTDPEAWIDGVLSRLKDVLALIDAARTQNEKKD